MERNDGWGKGGRKKRKKEGGKGKEKTQMVNIENEQQDISTNLTHIQKIVWEYCEQSTVISVMS